MYTFVFRRPDKRIMISGAVIAGAVAVGIILTVLLWGRDSHTLSYKGRSVSLLAPDEESICAFARDIGLDISQGLTLHREVTIPEVFDLVYEDYNSLQKSSGLDLYPYRGRPAKLYRCSIGKYGRIESAVATIIVCDGRIIGGDISDEVAGGEMRGLI